MHQGMVTNQDTLPFSYFFARMQCLEIYHEVLSELPLILLHFSNITNWRLNRFDSDQNQLNQLSFYP